MKDYRRPDPLFSLCGLNCGLCPIHHMDRGCPGCGGGEGHQPCKVIRCSREHGGPEYCSRCADFPCERLQTLTQYDSFLPTRNILRDLETADRIGIVAYRQRLDEKISMLQWLLTHCNDGRRKSFYCTVINLLELPVLRDAMARIHRETAGLDDLPARAEAAVRLLKEAAAGSGADWRLHKPPRKT